MQTIVLRRLKLEDRQCGVWSYIYTKAQAACILPCVKSNCVLIVSDLEYLQQKTKKTKTQLVESVDSGSEVGVCFTHRADEQTQ